MSPRSIACGANSYRLLSFGFLRWKVLFCVADSVAPSSMKLVQPLAEKVQCARLVIAAEVVRSFVLNCTLGSRCWNHVLFRCCSHHKVQHLRCQLQKSGLACTCADPQRASLTIHARLHHSSGMLKIIYHFVTNAATPLRSEEFDDESVRQ